MESLRGKEKHPKTIARKRPKRKAGGSSGDDWMDVNFTNQLAVSLSQSIIIVIAAAGLGACVAGGFGIIRDILKDRNKENNLAKTKRMQAYGQLVGIKNRLLHSYIMYFNSLMLAISSTCRYEVQAHCHRLNGMSEIDIEDWRSQISSFYSRM